MNKSIETPDGIIVTNISRANSIEEYYKNPNKCRHCGSVIRVKENRKVSEARRKVFCGYSCSASYNNTSSPKRKAKKSGKCLECGIVITYTQAPNGKYNRPKYCAKCCHKVGLRNRYSSQNYKCITTNETTKGDMRLALKHGSLFKPYIVKNASKAYRDAGKPNMCLICGYPRIEVCHIQSVASFSDTTPISVINNPDNLVGLCPNHHKEYDRGQLTLPIAVEYSVVDMADVNQPGAQ